jgi:poly(A) polymerase/tRNA nucleotidyltransferase (CCA-adding enzyme)
MRPGFLDEPALAAVLAALPRARVVGGAVRDHLLGLAVGEVDLATPEAPEDVVRMLAASGLKSAPTGIAHGTVTAIAPDRAAGAPGSGGKAGGRGFEVTTLRRDLATDGRHAVVAFGADWEADAARRDFTINAMSMDRDGNIFDYQGGRADLAAGRVRFVGDPASRIAEDYLRILRFFRFHARFGLVAADAATLAAISAGVPGLARLAPERVWRELRGLLAAPCPAPALGMMRATGVLAAVLPEASGEAPASGDALVRLAGLIGGAGEVEAARAVAARLRLSGAERDRLAALVAGPAPAGERRALRAAIATLGREVVVGRLVLAGAAPAVIAMAAGEDVPAFPLRGRDLEDLGIGGGRAMGALLREIEAWWLAGGAEADGASCLAEVLRRMTM